MNKPTSTVEPQHAVIFCFYVVKLNIDVTRIFDWEGPNHKLHAMTLSEIFERGYFVGQRYRRIEDQKSLSGLPKLKSENIKIGRRVQVT